MDILFRSNIRECKILDLRVGRYADGQILLGMKAKPGLPYAHTRVKRWIGILEMGLKLIDIHNPDRQL